MENQYTGLKNRYSEKGGSYYEMPRTEILPFIPDNIKTVLDIGCSSGEFGGLIKSTRPDVTVWGIEPDKISADKAALCLDKVINNTFSKDLPELEDKKFDLICFNDVLEHLVDPFETLTETKAFLNENSSIVASIPNILFYYQIAHILIKQDWKYQESGIMDYTHLRFFTKKSIVRMFESSGFTVKKIDGINGANALTYWIFNILTLGRLRDWRYPQLVVLASPDK